MKTGTPMISAKEALERVLAHARPLDVREGWAVDSVGLTLTRPVLADRDYPPFDRATMDGFAVRLAHAGATIRISGESRPGQPPIAFPDAESCVEIMTGAPCPEGTEAVVMKEEVAREGASVSLPSHIRAGQNVVQRGAECREGAVVLPEGGVVTALNAGLMATVGATTVWARRPPSLAILVTGDEIAQSVEEPRAVQIRDSNGPMLTAMARAAGVSVIEIQYVRDTTQTLAQALRTTEQADIVVLTGGVSAGNYDFVPQALAAHGATTIFHKVAQQPGKPLLFAVQGARLFFGLPGTPLGCHLGFFRYVVPALRVLAGRSPAHETAEGRMAASWTSSSERQQFVLARVVRDEHAWSVTPLAPRGSSDLFGSWSANAYLDIPTTTRALPEGATVAFQWLDK